MSEFTNGTAPAAEFDPLTSEPVNEKPYSQPNVRLTQDDLWKDIPEPTFMPPPLDGMDEPFPDEKEKKQPKNGEEPKSKKKEREPLMPEIGDLPEDEKEEAAEKLAETIVDGYEWVKRFGNSFCKISDRKMRKAFASGEIHPNVQIPWTGGEWVPFTEFVAEFNETAADTLKVDPKFRKKVLPPLTRILKKKGAGISDEAYLAIAFGQDIAVNAGMVFQMRNTIRDVFAIAREQTEAGRTSTQSRPQPAPQAPPPQPQPTYRPEPAPTPAYQPEPEPQFFEPEEHIAPQPDPVVSMVAQDDPDITMYTQPGKHKPGGFAATESNPAMPTFGDPSKLAKMERELGKEETRQTRKRNTEVKRERIAKKKRGKSIDEKPKKRGRGRPPKGLDY